MPAANDAISFLSLRITIFLFGLLSLSSLLANANAVGAIVRDAHQFRFQRNSFNIIVDDLDRFHHFNLNGREFRLKFILSTGNAMI